MPEHEHDMYDVAIVGAGVTGTALAFVLSRYTNMSRIAIIEKNNGAAEVNSHPRNNSQTLHFGDIETNYDFEHALELKRAGEMIARYVERKNIKGLFCKINKMVLAMGDREVATLKARFEQFRGAYPHLTLLSRGEIARIEPNVVKGRPKNDAIAALSSDNGYMVNYQKLAESFLEDSFNSEKRVDAFFSASVTNIKIRPFGTAPFARVPVSVETTQGVVKARFACFAAGPYSLKFAQKLGHGKGLSVLPVAGSFYFSRAVLNGKVYTVQEEGRPFAAVHGDPDIVAPNTTRFGPTAKIVFLMERRHLKTLFDFLRTPMATLRGLQALAKVILSDPGFAIRNALYDFPVVGKFLYLSSIRKIIPTMKYRDLRFGKGLGGLRPQVVDIKTGKLLMGESKIYGDLVIFNTTPSPGASSSLRNAEKDARAIVGFLGGNACFDEEGFARDFGIA